MSIKLKLALKIFVSQYRRPFLAVASAAAAAGIVSCVSRTNNASKAQTAESLHDRTLWDPEWLVQFTAPLKYLRSEIGERPENDGNFGAAPDWERLNALRAVFPELADLKQVDPMAREKCLKTKKDGLEKIMTSRFKAEKVLVPFFRNKISKLLLGRYLSCNGNPVILDLKEVTYMIPVVDGYEAIQSSDNTRKELSEYKLAEPFSAAIVNQISDRFLHDAQFRDSLESQGIAPASFKVLMHAFGGNIGRFTSHFKGQVKWARQKATAQARSVKTTIEFRGYMAWQDTYDFDRKQDNVRSKSDEDVTRLFDSLFTGLPLEVRTIPVPVFLTAELQLPTTLDNQSTAWIPKEQVVFKVPVEIRDHQEGYCHTFLAFTELQFQTKIMQSYWWMPAGMGACVAALTAAGTQAAIVAGLVSSGALLIWPIAAGVTVPTTLALGSVAWAVKERFEKGGKYPPGFASMKDRATVLPDD